MLGASGNAQGIARVTERWQGTLRAFFKTLKRSTGSARGRRGEFKPGSR